MKTANDPHDIADLLAFVDDIRAALAPARGIQPNVWGATKDDVIEDVAAALDHLDVSKRNAADSHFDPLAILTRVLDNLPADLEERVPALDVVRIVRLTVEECGR